ncbi:cytidylate kinase-like family protein [Desulforhopalus vacuolatus]|uniref:cytidylate kinase-like family protein n=1 Tax=Desulforhopalus vacuolatus TaxID=40414 RepID=UPI00196585B0|nr:cytidylate kinase-like family protein [Desulforhopalus vacuolatus]MBM9519311.1 cytidylate kinase-like family protein [Desulforhopalus vacuolatus]
MSIVTIARGSYNKGKEVAEGLAEALGCECLSRDILLEASDRFNIPEIKLVKALHDAPSVLERFSHGKERYFAYFKSAFLSHISEGNVVYHGLAGHFLLREMPNVLKVKVNARMEDRVIDEMERESCSQYTACSNLQRDDEERRKWGMQLYGLDPWDARLFDIVCNVDTLKVPDIVSMLERLCRLPQFKETEESLKYLRQAAKVAGIKALVIDTSPNARVEIINKKKIKLVGVKGDKKFRHKLEQKLVDLYDIEDVVFKKTSRVDSGHINVFHSLE